jgi:hypothetical protein
MDWLVPLLVVLGLAALAGIVWLHVGTQPPPRDAATSNPDGLLGHSAIGDEHAEQMITLRYLRRRAVYYRDLADKVADPVSGARYWDIAGTLDRAADALEADQPTTKAPTAASPDQ